MRRERRKRVRETEAVGKHDVAATTHTELVFEEYSTVKPVAHDGLSRRDHHVICIDTAARNIPASCIDIFLQTGILCRIILPHPFVADSTFEVEAEIGILVKQRQILIQRIFHILVDSSHNVPVPLSIKVRIGNKQKSFAIGLRKSREARQQ